ncbi:GDP-fucose protein O-fucosyltransferase 1-like [Pecten maximus]|uniref:GDP-fucose protein O-fucosyltransferase 1-like n=1 Tax=Pecten maximus TaxID=6579 RepID=UPI0014590DDA|nr:GDP-fucose protein O-fucosyltransferase 1-like [Pecten maximus]XP_033738886.1 GDP-fucose protein O-fucosyltransferase 1-like [Pecten maximus]
MVCFLCISVILVQLLALLTVVGSTDDLSPDGSRVAPHDLEWDERGYILFCLCMGRFGNQAEHFLGGLAFAKAVDRTLILPPWRTYKNVPFNEWFDVTSVGEYHRVITAEDFMEKLAPKYWPQGNRTGYCFGYQGSSVPCKMKEGNPFGPFWDGLGVYFDRSVSYHVMYTDHIGWRKRFPADEEPVVALKGAPAPYPMAEDTVPLQKYLRWSSTIEDEVQSHIAKMFEQERFIGIHLRNGVDWKNACKNVEGESKFMASPQCLGYEGKNKISAEMCFPSDSEIFRLLEKVVKISGIHQIYVATDKNPLTKEIEKHFTKLQVKVHHLDPWLPQIDLAILGKSDYFIGNCISSFTAFVARERLISGKPTFYWGYSS